MTWLLFLPAARGQTFYGSRIAGDSLNNHQVSTIDVDFRFRAAISSQPKSLLWYDISKINSCPPPSGGTYGCGNGGIMHISIQGDDGSTSHLANGNELCSGDDNSPLNPPALRSQSLSGCPTLTPGTLYHIHWHNTSPDPVNNFTSVDACYTWDTTTPRQETTPDVDMAVFRGTTLQPQDTPIFQLTYANGQQQGMGYMEYWGLTSPTPFAAGNTILREQFTVASGACASSCTVSSVSVRMSRDSGNAGSSPLTVRLETASGTLIEQGTIPATTFPVSTLTDSSTNLNAWGTYTFTTPRTLTSGQSYHLVLRSPSDTTYKNSPIRKGSSYNFTPTTFFGDGYGQISSDGGNTWAGFNGGSTEGDLQFYFTLGSSQSSIGVPTGLTAVVQ